eukprot:Gb_32035 [translate_table: standard]
MPFHISSPIFGGSNCSKCH